MGFYGNITNTSKTNFVFDKIYTNRKAMDEHISEDGIFIGRYVLVEYGEITNDSFIRAYGPKEDGYYHISNDEAEVTRILYTADKNKVKDRYITNGIVIYTITKNSENEDVYTYYECNDGEFMEEKEGEKIYRPKFSETPGIDIKNDPYFYNFNQDKAVEAYGGTRSRGYDGTVWVKTSANNKIKYVNIAELNSVVPSFDMVADAPTMSPILPHFDTASNNVYYKLHWQPAWGMRIAEADNLDRSDYKTAWSQEFYNKETGEAYTKWYNPATGEWDSDSPCEIAADIYFNKAAFDPQINQTTINKTVKMENYMGITADGLSGNKYNLHNSTSGTEQKPDTQQIHINLPAIGNMMSEAWDIIHGPKRDNAQTDNNSSLQGRLDSFKAMEKNAIPMKRNNDGTFVGSRINGNSNRTVGTNKILEENLSTSFDQDDAWIRTKIDTTNLDNKNKFSGISIHHTWHKQADTTSTTNKNSDNVSSSKASDKIDLYTPIVDKAGHVVGKNIETVTLPYGYKTIKVTNTEDTVVSEANAEIKSNGQSADNTQDILTLSASNRWIKLDNNSEDDQIKIGHKHSGFATGTSANTYYGLTQNEDHTKSANNKGDLDKDNTFEVPCLKFDEAGHILEARTHTVTLPEIFKKVVIGNENSNTDNTSHTAGSLEADTMNDNFTIKPGNKWVQMTADANNDTFSVQHYVNKFTETTPTAIDYNSASTKQFSIQAIGWDEAGHLTSSAKTTYTLPDGFKTIAITNGGSSTTTFGTGTTNINLVAETLTDTATIDTGNRWLTLVANADGDKVTLYHAAAGNASTSKNLQSNNTVAPKFGGSFKVLTAGIDQAGHVKNLGDYSITLPTPSLSTGSAEATSASVITGIVLADKTTGAFTKSTANVGTLKLTGYSNDDSNNLTSKTLQITSDNTINEGIKTIQNYINGLDVDENGSAKAPSKYVSSVTQKDGKITVDYAGTEALQINGYNSNSSDQTKIYNGNTVNDAFKKLEGRLDVLQGEDSQIGSVAYQIAQIVNENANGSIDTLNEIAGWIVNDTTGAAAMANDIAILKGADTTNGSVKKSIKDAIAKLDSSAAVSNTSINYLTGITIVDGKIAGKTEGTLGSAAFTEAANYATAEQGTKANTAIQLDTEIAYKIQKDDETGNTTEVEVKTTIEAMAQEIADLRQILKDNGLITA